MSQTRRLKRTGSSCLGLLVRLTPSGSEGDCPWDPLAGSFIDSLVAQQFLCACLQRSCHLLPGSACVLLFFKDLLLFICLYVCLCEGISWCVGTCGVQKRMSDLLELVAQCGCWGLNLDPLVEQEALSITKSSPKSSIVPSHQHTSHWIKATPSLVQSLTLSRGYRPVSSIHFPSVTFS